MFGERHQAPVAPGLAGRLFPERVQVLEDRSACKSTWASVNPALDFFDPGRALGDGSP